MQIVACPSCGAQVTFRSHAAVMAVCEFCRAAVLKDVDSVRHVGTVSDVLEDFSPLQIGASGSTAQRGFTVIGRIQLRYAQGMWNEWFVMFDDGASGWLGDSSGLYTMTAPREVDGPLPAFDDLQPGRQYTIGTEQYTVAEKRLAECIGGQGELPFRVGDGWRVRVADLRRGAAFITLDYTEGERALVYGGQAVTLDAMQMQLLRDADQIKTSAGKYRGKVDALDCPSCGSMINYIPGVTGTLVCPACSSQLDAAGPEATVLAAGKRLQDRRTSIEIGAAAKIDNRPYVVLGAMVRADDEETEWTEYLLYNPVAGFFWLVESDDGWFKATVMPVWPECRDVEGDGATFNNVVFTKTYDYQATVRFAAGAFNWRVAVGDVVTVHEFERGQISLAAERTAEEMTWSLSTALANDQVRQWFPSIQPTPASAGKSRTAPPVKFIWWLLGLNAIPLLMNFGTTFIYLIIAIFAILMPPQIFSPRDEDDV